jgi:hypothetical protein
VGGDFCSKLSANDLEPIETLKLEKGSISLKEIYAVLEQAGEVGGDISLSSISRTIKDHLLSGKLYSRKKISHIARERFTFNNMLYIHNYSSII